MKINTRKKISLYTLVQRFAARVFLLLLLVSCSPSDARAALPGPSKLLQCATVWILRLFANPPENCDRLIRAINSLDLSGESHKVFEEGVHCHSSEAGLVLDLSGESHKVFGKVVNGLLPPLQSWRSFVVRVIGPGGESLEMSKEPDGKEKISVVTLPQVQVSAPASLNVNATIGADQD